MSSIGSLSLDLFVREHDVEQSLSRIPQLLERMGSRLTRIANTLGAQVGYEIGSRIVDGLAGMSRAAIATGADFEKAMSGVKAITGATAGAMDGLRNQALTLARTTAFSATEIAGAMEQLGAAGFSTQQILSALPSTLKLAEAGSIGIGEASQIAAAAINNLAIPAEDMGRVADVLAKASAESATDVHQLGESFKFVAPIGRQFGKGLEQLVAPLEVLANAGLRAEMAGTGLRQVMSDLSGEDTAANKLFNQLGVNIDRLKLLPLADQVDALNLAFKDTGNVEKAGELLKAFGQRSGPTMAALLNQGGDALRKMEIGLRNADGAAQKIANTRLDNVAGSWQKAFHAFQEVGIGAFESVRPQLRGILDRMTSETQAFAAKVPAAMSGIVDWVQGAMPVVTQSLHTVWAGLSAVGEMAAEAGQVIGKFYDWATGGNLPIRKALAYAEGIFSGWSHLMNAFVAGAELGFLQLWNGAKHLLTVNVPEAFDFVLKNWRSIIEDMGNLAFTFFENFANNLANLVTSLPELLAGKVDFDKLWTPLLNGLPQRQTPSFNPTQRPVDTTEAYRTNTALKEFSDFLSDVDRKVADRLRAPTKDVLGELGAKAGVALDGLEVIGKFYQGVFELELEKRVARKRIADALAPKEKEEEAAPPPKVTITGLAEGWAAVQRSVFNSDRPEVKVAKEQLKVQQKTEGHQKGLRDDIAKLARLGGMGP